ncbi:MAG: phage terminase large subunit [Anaerostipes hadrus]
MDTAQHYILRLMNDSGRNLLCVRKADVTNRDSTFAELQGAIFRMFGERYKRYWYINTSNMIIECKSNHNQIIFRGVNDERQREKTEINHIQARETYRCLDRRSNRDHTVGF